MSSNEVDSVKQKAQQLVREVSEKNEIPYVFETDPLGFCERVVAEAITSTKQEMVEDLRQMDKELSKGLGVGATRASIRMLIAKYSNELQDRKVEE